MKIVIVMLLLVSLPALAVDEGHVSRVTHEVSNEIYSPFCPGKTLAMCPSPNAAEVRMQIQNMAMEGMDEQQIKENVIRQYGEEFRLVDPPLLDNVGLLGALLVGMFGAGSMVWLWSQRRKGDPAEPKESKEKPVGNDYVDELREEYRS